MYPNELLFYCFRAFKKEKARRAKSHPPPPPQNALQRAESKKLGARLSQETWFSPPSCYSSSHTDEPRGVPTRSRSRGMNTRSHSTHEQERIGAQQRNTARSTHDGTTHRLYMHSTPSKSHLRVNLEMDRKQMNKVQSAHVSCTTGCGRRGRDGARPRPQNENKGTIAVAAASHPRS